MLAHAPRLAAPDDPETALILVRTVMPPAGQRIPSAVVYQAIRIMGSLGRTKPELQPLFTTALTAVLNNTAGWPRWAGDEIRQSALDALAQFDTATCESVLR